MAMINNHRVMGSNANFTGFIWMGHGNMGDSWGYFLGFSWNMLLAVAIDESNPSFYHVNFIGFSIISHPAIGVPPFMEPPICMYILQPEH